MILRYTAGQIASLSGLSVKNVLKQLHSQSLPHQSGPEGIYLIEESQFKKWKCDIPSLTEIKENSIFSGDIPVHDFSANIIETNLGSKESFSESHFKKKSHFPFADLFCGCGGMGLGFVEAGYRPVACVDVFEDALKTYKKNILEKYGFKMPLFLEKPLDITLEKNKKRIIQHLNATRPKVICGGFPCQGFSSSGTSVPSDPRNKLYLDMLEIVNAVQPEYIVMENVVGLTRMLDGKVVNKIIDDYFNIGYQISYQIVNAVWFGVPQNRERVIFIGNRLGQQNPFPLPLYDDHSYQTVRAAISKFGNIENKTINHFFSNHSEEMKNRLQSVPIGGCLYPEYHDSWRKTSPDLPSCTIKENHGATNIHYEYNRTMSPREIAALQSFPDDFIFDGTKSSMLKQIGNAVPPLMAKAVALSLKKYL